MGSNGLTGSLAAQVQTNLLQSQQDRMVRQLQSQEAAGNDGKIEKSAQEFESMLLNTWLQQAEESMATVPGAEDDEEASGRQQMMSLGVQSLSTALAAAGGIGIGKMVAQALHHEADKGKTSSNPAVTGNSAQVQK